MSWFILLIIFSNPLGAQSPEEILRAAVDTRDLNCIEQKVEIDHCSNFHSAACENEKFQNDGTNTERTEEAWEKRKKIAMDQSQKEMIKELEANFKNVTASEWRDFFKFSELTKDCEKFPPLNSCKDEFIKKQSSHIVNRLISPNLPKPSDRYNSENIEQEIKRPELLKKLNVPGIEMRFGKILLDRLRFKEDEDRMMKMSVELKDLMVEKIFKFVPEQSQREIILNQLNKTEFKGFECDGNNLLKSYSIKGAFNTRTKNEGQHITYCAGNFSSNNSAFNMAYLLVHEMAHSIDPCNLRAKDKSKLERTFLESQHPFSNVIGCLRSPDSVGAEFSDEMFSPEIVDSSFCKNDQITESFSDWLAAEVVPNYLKKAYPNLTQSDYKQGYMNVSRTLNCKTEIEDFNQKVNEHPKPIFRINNIMMANPLIRKSVGCNEVNSGKPTYCSGSNDLSKLTPPQKKMRSKFTFPQFNSMSTPSYDSCFKK